MKLQQLISLNFNEGCKALMKAKLPEKTSYNVSKKIRKISKEQEIFNELKNDKIKNLSLLDKDGTPLPDKNGNYVVLSENIEQFQKEMKELLEIEIQGIEPIKLADLGDKHGLTPGDFLNLGDFIIE